MSVRVRFAPSPTGYLHIGGARTALYSYLYAKAKGGSFVLRIEDTDLERSKREYEQAQIADLEWLGLVADESPNKPGEFGPYRQSERLEIYKKMAWDLVEKGLAYPCFLSQAELDELSAQAEAEKKAPHTYHGQYRDADLAESKKKIEQGAAYVIRFKNPQKPYKFNDLVRGEVSFQEDMVGDFVILRASGMPVYNFCCTVDDHLMKISHVIRAEEHLNNTLRQLMLYEAFEATPPEFAHVSLLVGEDRQKLSKRHGATSVSQYKEQHYLPEALVNYLCLLGWSHPEEKDIFELDEIIPLFDLSRFSKSSALYDIQKLNFFNEQHMRKLSDDQWLEKVEKALPDEDPFHKQTGEWKQNFVTLYKEKIQVASMAQEKIDEIFREQVNLEDPDLKEALSWETTPALFQYISDELAKIPEEEKVSVENVEAWMGHLKKELKIKGKPLFMGTRAVLTGQTHGPDLKLLVALTPVKVLKNRLSQVAQALVK